MKRLWQRGVRLALAFGLTVERIWARHWLLIVGAILLGVSVSIRWIDFPLGRDVTGIQFPLVGKMGLVPHQHLLSFGVLSFGLLAWSVFLLRWTNAPLILTVTFLIAVWAIVPCRIAFEQPALLLRLVNEVNDASLTKSFTKQYFPENFGREEESPSHLDLHTALGRFNAATAFLGLGWCGMGAALLALAAYSLQQVRRRKVVVVLALIFVPILAFLTILLRPFIAQHYFIQARIAQSLGHNQEAILNYRKAMWWDQWHEQDISVYSIIGGLQRQADIETGSPERHVNKAMELAAASHFEAAAFELNQAAGGGGPVAIAARRQAARVHLELGLALYHAGGIGAAVTSWEKSLAEDPNQLQALVFLARASYDVARYQSALDLSNKVISAAGLNSVLANAYSLTGDCHSRLGQDEEARKNYAHSLKLDNDINFWAAAALAGN